MRTPDRFWSFVAIGKDDDCWQWLGSIDTRGYGQLKWLDTTARAHRTAWLLEHGDIPEGKGHHKTVVRHSCDNRLCCNPKHLMLGSHSDNMKDMADRSRRKGIGRAQDNGRAILNWDQVRAIRASDLSILKASAAFGISKAQIQRIRAGKQWVEAS